MHPPPPTDPESVALDETTRALAACESDLKFAQRQLAERCQLRRAAEQQQQLCQQTLDEINRRRQLNNDQLLRTQRELLEQPAKLERARRELKLARRTAHAKFAGPPAARLFESVERELRARELSDGNASALQQLGDMAEAFGGMATVVAQRLWAHGLRMPMRAASFQRLCREDSRSELTQRDGSVSTLTPSVRSISSGSGSPAPTASLASSVTATKVATTKREAGDDDAPPPPPVTALSIVTLGFPDGGGDQLSIGGGGSTTRRTATTTTTTTSTRSHKCK